MNILYEICVLCTLCLCASARANIMKRSATNIATVALTGSTGTFKTMNYPNYYPDDTSQRWTISATAGSVRTIPIINSIQFVDNQHRLWSNQNGDRMGFCVHLCSIKYITNNNTCTL